MWDRSYRLETRAFLLRGFVLVAHVSFCQIACTEFEMKRGRRQQLLIMHRELEFASQGEDKRVPASCVPTDSSKFPQKTCLRISNNRPSVETMTLVIETHMIKAVSEQIPANASFFRTSICTFQRMLVETSMTGTSVRVRIIFASREK